LEELAKKIESDYASNNNELVYDEEMPEHDDKIVDIKNNYSSHHVKGTHADCLLSDNMNETIKNTIYNKFIGKLPKESHK